MKAVLALCYSSDAGGPSLLFLRTPAVYGGGEKNDRTRKSVSIPRLVYSADSRGKDR